MRGRGFRATAVEKKLKAWVVKPVQLSEKGPFSSHFGEFSIDGVKVEVMGELALRGVYEGLGRRVVLKVGGASVPAEPLEAELEAYRLLGREEKARKIEETLKKK